MTEMKKKEGGSTDGGRKTAGIGSLGMRRLAAGLGMAVLLVFLVLLDVLCCFHHGYYTDARPYENVGVSSILGTYSLADGAYEMSFTPAKDYLAGAVVYLAANEQNNAEGTEAQQQGTLNQGMLHLEVLDADGRVLAEGEKELSEIPAEHAYKLSLESGGFAAGRIRRGETYTLRISAEGDGAGASLILVDEGFRMTESKDDPLLIAFAYGEADFTTQEKVLITIFAFGGILLLLSWGWGAGRDVPGRRSAANAAVGKAAGAGADSGCGAAAVGDKDSSNTRRGAAVGIPGIFSPAFGKLGLCLILTAGLAWNYSFNSMDGDNDTFENFQADSEALVTAGIEAVWKGIPNPSGTGLIKLERLDGESGAQTAFPDDEDWNQGYHRTDPAVRFPASEYAEEYVVPGNSIRFANGEEHAILAVLEADSDWLTVVLDAEAPMDAQALGSLSNASVVLADGTPAPEETAAPYESQYGLQGKIFQKLSVLLRDEGTLQTQGLTQALSDCEDVLRLLCALATAGTLLLISFLILRKYGRLMAGIFYAVFLLSPWVVNFANNLYWVEFTWFLPMAAGLWCSLRTERRFARVASYVLVFITIMIKCLCGYEYISSVMLGAILFLLVDFFSAAAERNAGKTRLLVRTIFFMGIAALAGFAAAICLHAPVKSGGSLTEGIRMIIQEDVLRRTYGADLNAFESLPDFEQAGLNASAWATLCKYFHFKTEVITGIAGNLFPLLCLVPIVLFAWDYKKEKVKCGELALYAVSFLVPVSWFILAKSHSYVHTHMNFVLWYMGYVQVCLYVIARHLRDWVQRR